MMYRVQVGLNVSSDAELVPRRSQAADYCYDAPPSRMERRAFRRAQSFVKCSVISVHSLEVPDY
jgi:hypothetical protein